MDYNKHYHTLIQKAKSRVLEGYVEKHHILPKCMGGTDTLDNLVALTPEEHFVAHQLLIKIYPNEPKLIYAAQMMCIKNKKHQRNNKFYGWLKRKFSLSRLGQKRKKYKKETQPRKQRAKETKPRKPRFLTEEHKKKIGMANKGKIRSPELRASISKFFKGKPLSEETRMRMSEAGKNAWKRRKQQ